MAVVLGRAHARPPRHGRGRRLRRGGQPARRRGRARGDGRRVRGRARATISATASSPRSSAGLAAGRRGGAGALGRDAARRRRAPGRSPTCASTGTTSRSTSSRACGCSGSRSSTPMSRARSTRRRRRATACPATSNPPTMVRAQGSDDEEGLAWRPRRPRIPCSSSVDYPDRPLNRLTSAFRIFTAIPIVILLAALGREQRHLTRGAPAATPDDKQRRCRLRPARGSRRC